MIIWDSNKKKFKITHKCYYKMCKTHSRVCMSYHVCCWLYVGFSQLANKHSATVEVHLCQMRLTSPQWCPWMVLGFCADVIETQLSPPQTQWSLGLRSLEWITATAQCPTTAVPIFGRCPLCLTHSCSLPFPSVGITFFFPFLSVSSHSSPKSQTECTW
jgi:hypothetical protein